MSGSDKSGKEFIPVRRMLEETMKSYLDGNFYDMPWHYTSEEFGRMNAKDGISLRDTLSFIQTKIISPDELEILRLANEIASAPYKLAANPYYLNIDLQSEYEERERENMKTLSEAVAIRSCLKFKYPNIIASIESIYKFTFA